jgi:CheY-like chemotaxis protein
VLLDTMMPVVDGPTTAELWRQLETRLEMPRAFIVTVTALNESQKCEHVDAFLKKPLLFGDLKAVHDRFIRI